MKGGGRKITALTAYDAPTGAILDEAGIDIILVGDSVGMVKLGYETTLPVTLQDMVHHARAVRRGVKRALVCVDLPFLSYEASPADAVRSAGRFLKECGTEAVKLEGGASLKSVEAIVKAKIPVMGHVGLTPQAIHQLGGYRVQGKTSDRAHQILSEAQALEAAGVFSIVLEAIPTSLARDITGSVRIPTIGIGAGPSCDGQILVIDDLVGMTGGVVPKFVKQYAQLRQQMVAAVRSYRDDVIAQKYPDSKHSYELSR